MRITAEKGADNIIQLEALRKELLTFKRSTFNLDREIKMLEARKVKLEHLMHLHKQVSDLELKLMLADTSLCKQVRIITLEVSRHYKVPFPMITSRCKEDWVCWPRHVIAFISRELCGGTLKAIGHIMQRDHGAILNSIHAVADRSAIDTNAKEEVTHLLAVCRKALEEAAE